MNLPKVLADLVTAQNQFDSIAYTNCFSETAVVFDEGKTHTGKKEISNEASFANPGWQNKCFVRRVFRHISRKSDSSEFQFRNCRRID
jgi:hypothetical protein